MVFVIFNISYACRNLTSLTVRMKCTPTWTENVHLFISHFETNRLYKLTYNKMTGVVFQIKLMDGYKSLMIYTIFTTTS